MTRRRKLIYQVPKLIHFDAVAATGTGQCQVGSAANQCFNGTAAVIHSCSLGTGAACSLGTQYAAVSFFQLLKR